MNVLEQNKRNLRERLRDVAIARNIGFMITDSNLIESLEATRDGERFNIANAADHYMRKHYDGGVCGNSTCYACATMRHACPSIPKASITWTTPDGIAIGYDEKADLKATIKRLEKRVQDLEIATGKALGAMEAAGNMLAVEADPAIVASFLNDVKVKVDFLSTDEDVIPF